MSAIQKLIEDSARGYSFLLEIENISLNLSGQVKKTISRDGVQVSTDSTYAQSNTNGPVQTEEQIIQLEEQDPRVREFAEYLLEKEAQKYVFEEVPTESNSKVSLITGKSE